MALLIFSPTTSNYCFWALFSHILVQNLAQSSSVMKGATPFPF